jgi:hypothetical protein
VTTNKHLPELVIHNADLVGGDGPATTLHTDRGCISISAAGPSLRHFDAAGLLVAPGFVDLQCNGAVGIDLTAEPERLWELAAALPRCEQDEQDEREQQRKPASFDDLGQVRREELEVTTRKAAPPDRTSHNGFRQSIRTTTKNRIVSIASVPVTAMP